MSNVLYLTWTGFRWSNWIFIYYHYFKLNTEEDVMAQKRKLLNKSLMFVLFVVVCSVVLLMISAFSNLHGGVL